MLIFFEQISAPLERFAYLAAGFDDKVFLANRDRRAGMNMAHEKIIFLFQANPGNTVNAAVRENAAASRVRRQAGFSLLELLIVLAVVGILLGLATFGIREALEGMRANKARNQVIACLTNARDLAISQNSRVVIQFPSDTRIQVIMWKRDDVTRAWVQVNIEPTNDPSITLENGYRFRRGNDWPAPLPEGSGLSVPNPIVVGNQGYYIPPEDIFDFNEDGFLTRWGQPDNPLNADICISAPNDDRRFARAATIMGLTGRIRGWQIINNRWERSR